MSRLGSLYMHSLWSKLVQYTNSWVVLCEPLFVFVLLMVSGRLFRTVV